MMKMETDLEIKVEDALIPLLQPVDTKYLNYSDGLWQLFIQVEDYDELIEVAERKYKKVALDIFNKKMASEDPRLALLSNDYFKLSQEYKFIGFIKKVFDLNNRQCYIDLGTFTDNQKVVEFLNNQRSHLDQIDSYILMNQFTVLGSSKQPIYLINDRNMLIMFVKCMLREVLWSSLYFNKIPLIMKTNYDISLPLIFQNEKDQQFYENIANENELYFIS